MPPTVTGSVKTSSTLGEGLAVGRKKRKRSESISGQKEKGEKKIASTVYKQHSTTDAQVTGLGKQAARLPGRMAAEQLWSFQAKSPKWLPPAPRTKLPPGGMSSAAAVELELERAHGVNRLRRKLQDLCKGAGIDVVPKLAFEKWRFSMKWREERHGMEQGSTQQPGGAKKKKKNKKKGAIHQFDPLIPCLLQIPGEGSPLVEPGLVADMERAGASTSSAEAIARALAEESQRAAREVAVLMHKLASGKPVMSESEAPVLIGHKHSLDMRCHGQFVKLTLRAMTKLQLLYTRNAPLDDGAHEEIQTPEAGQESPQSAFTNRLFALLLRYKTIQGHGFQAAAGPEVFRILTERLGVALECFASPLNTFLGQFCSAFPDVDCPFGSRGSFWSFEPAAGSYQVNPPFVSCIMDAMADRLLWLLSTAENCSAPLSFVVFIPGWVECKCWSVLKSSPFLRGELLIAAKDHGYCDGASHQRKDSFRISCYDTGVFFVQTNSASQKWVVSGDLMEDLRRAMALSVPTESAAKRQMRSR
mmetsp:Transcript_8464/g.24271  ORF Transcript_8464/g.24271 Transcript_8464/m.24271 type:complete len:531 (+) Transcript_8464:145-1737(+)